MSSQFELLKEQRFRPFFFTQFLGAFNDNVFKTALITLVTFHTATLTQISGEKLATILPGVFILPFFLFSATAGQIADKFEKSQLIRFVKLFEIGIMLFASAGFFLRNLWLLSLALLMMGLHSALFGPVKYSYLPQHLKENELIGGNGMLEMGSFVAILLGQVLGAWLANASNFTMSLIVIGLAVLGYLSSRGIPYSAPSDDSLKVKWNPVIETWVNLKFAWNHQVIWVTLIAISWFWFYGAVLLAQFPVFAKNVLHGDESVFVLLLSVFSLGIGVGSLMCEKLAKGRVELGLVLFGGIGMALFGLDFAHTGAMLTIPSGANFNYQSFLFYDFVCHRLLADVVLVGIFAGFYIVPLYTFVQTAGLKSHQSRLIAANNILNAFFMVVSAAFSVWLFSYGLNIPQLFLITACLHVMVIFYLCWRQPRLYHDFVSWLKRKHVV
ncbi:MAG TPA: MFS transporter [Methylophilus sp.]|nr:MFS transporter [Methylophilus sp.]HQQ33780.1 MFS transporter [Methylophilus sp.]